MSFFGFGKSYLYPKYYWDFRVTGSIYNLSGAAVPQVAFSGSGPGPFTSTGDAPAGETITYSIGATGSAAAAGANAGDGGSTTMILLGTQMTGSGGEGGYALINSTGSGGTATGGMTNISGGAGRGALFNEDKAGQGGGGIGSASLGTEGGTTVGGSGAQSVNIERLQAAVEAAGYSWTGPGIGDEDAGDPATGFGCGGAGGDWGSVLGGAGYLGGGGGGSGTDSGDKAGSSGGSGSLVIRCFNGTGSSTVVVKTSGTSYSVPAGTVTVAAWAIGGGGGGAGAKDAGTWKGCGGGGGAGGLAYRYWGRDPASFSLGGTQIGTINTNWQSGSNWLPSSSVGGYLGNSSLRFDGINDYGDLAPMTFGTEWSISCWSRFDSANDDSYDRVWDFGYPSDDDKRIALFRASSPNTEVGLCYHAAGAWKGGVSSTGIGNIVEGEWFHVVGTYGPTAGTLKVYWNGTLARTDTGLTAFPVGERSLNYLATAVGLTNFGEVSVSDFCIHNAALDAVSIENLYSGSVSPTAVSSSNIVAYFPVDEGSGKYLRQAYPSAISSSLTGNLLNTDCAGWTYNTPFSGAAADANQFYGYSFDGTSNYVTLSEISSSTKWSVTGWAKTSLAAVTNYARVFEFNNPAEGSIISLAQNGTGEGATETQARLYYDDTTGANTEFVEVDNFWEVDKWVHFGVTTDGTNLNLYKNATLVSGGVMSYSHTAQTRSLNAIGTRPSDKTARLWNGGVAELAVWDFDLTDMQVKALYNSGSYTFSNTELEYKQTYLSGSTFVTGNVPQ